MIVLWRCDVGSGCDFMFEGQQNMFYGISPVNVLHAPPPEGPPLTACLLRNKKSRAGRLGLGKTDELVLLMKYDYIYTKY